MIISLNRKQVAASRLEAEKDNVVVPTTIEEYCLKPKKKPSVPEADILTDFYDDDYADDMDDDDEDADEYNDDNEDSGNGESWKSKTLHLMKRYKQILSSTFHSRTAASKNMVDKITAGLLTSCLRSRVSSQKERMIIQQQT